MSQLTIRNFGDDLYQAIRELAEQEQVSLNKAVLRLLRLGAGLQQEGAWPKTVGSGLDDLIGSWSEQDAADMRENTAMFEQIDEEMWR